MCESVTSNDCFIGLYRHIHQAGYHTAGRINLLRIDIGFNINILMTSDNHSHLFERSISGTFADTVDSNFHLAGAVQHTCHCIGSSHPQVVVAMRGDDSVMNAVHMLHQIFYLRTILTGKAVTGGIGNIHHRSARFDNKGDRFYDLISALHKSVRGSAPDAALYWYARIITAGGDPLYVARRCLAIASEDVGNADPRAMQVAIAAWDCFTRVGPAEGERAIAQAIVYLACAPKSNAVYTAFKAALADARERPDYDVPVHLRNAPTKLMKEMGYGQEYRYAHDEANAYAAGEVYFPPEIAQTRYYFPTNRGLEGKIGEKLAWLAEQDQNSPIKRYR